MDRRTVTPGSVREDIVAAVLATCLVGGVLADAWAHVNLIETLESFFTPWHALLYGGFAGTAAWTFWLAYRRRDQAPVWWRDGWPAGYRLGALGVVLFGVGGVADMFWHTIFGIETGIDVAFSPSHMLLAFSAVLLVTSPARSWWAAGGGGPRAAAGVWSLALGAVWAGVLLTGWSVFQSAAPTQPYDYVEGSPSEMAVADGLASYLITTLVLAVPLLLAHRRRATPGLATALVFASAGYFLGMREYPATLTIAALVALAGAVLADVVLVRLDAVRGTSAPLRLPIAGAVFAGLVWTGHLVGLHLAEGVRWPPELWTGIVVFCAVLAAALGALAARPVATGATPPPAHTPAGARPAVDRPPAAVR